MVDVDGRGGGVMSRVLCRRGVARGAESCAFTIDDLIEALPLQPHNTGCVYVEPDAAGRITAAGGAARAAAAARLAPSAPARSADLALAPLRTTARTAPGAPALLLRATAPLAPHHEPLLWFADDLLLALAMPFLTPRNVRAAHRYVCHECGAHFDEPNPLKLHLFLRCEPFDAARFWREAAARLRATPLPLVVAPAAAAAGGPAALEALAAEWGRSRDGHVCVYCGKLYSRRYGLKIHLRTHTGYRPLRCRYCLRAFGDPSNLNKHVRLHAARDTAPGSTAPYSCGACGRTLARRRDLERHVRAHGSPPSPK